MPVLRHRSSRRRVSPSDPDARSRKEWLRQAMQEALDMDEADAESVASLVMDTFSGGDEVDDDTLNPQLRSMFYTLESERILTFRRIEYQDEDGRTLRGFFWRLNAAYELDRRVDMEVAGGNVYESLPANAWQREQVA